MSKRILCRCHHAFNIPSEPSTFHSNSNSTNQIVNYSMFRKERRRDEKNVFTFQTSELVVSETGFFFILMLSLYFFFVYKARQKKTRKTEKNFQERLNIRKKSEKDQKKQSNWPSVFSFRSFFSARCQFEFNVCCALGNQQTDIDHLNVLRVLCTCRRPTATTIVNTKSILDSNETQTLYANNRNTYTTQKN